MAVEGTCLRCFGPQLVQGIIFALQAIRCRSSLTKQGIEVRRPGRFWGWLQGLGQLHTSLHAHYTLILLMEARYNGLHSDTVSSTVGQ